MVIWKRAIRIAKDVYFLTKKFPREEFFSSTDQMRRSAKSISYNIAEGCNRGSDKDFRRFLYISLGSLSELESQLYLAVELEFVKEFEISELLLYISITGKMIVSLIKKLN